MLDEINQVAQATSFFTVERVFLGFILVLLVLELKWLFDMHGRISELEGAQKERLATSKSPMSLTDAGKKMLEDSGGKNYIHSHKEVLFDEFSDADTAFDIQERAKSVIRERLDHSDFKEIKEYLYKEGKSVDDIVLVMGLYLRDEALKNKNIGVEQVSINTPREK